MRTPLLLLAVLFAGTAQAASVHERQGNIFYAGEDGASRQLTFLHADTKPLLAPDGRKVAYLRAKPNTDANEIWLSDISGKGAQRVLDTKPDDSPEKNLAQFNSLAFSADGNLLYFLSVAWATSNALHVLDLNTGKEHFVTDANDVRVIAEGRYAGYLVVQKHKYFKQGGSYDYYWLASPAGAEVKMVGETEAQLARFIRAQRAARK